MTNEPLDPPRIGKHLATFNLFRETNGLYITIADATGVRSELGQSGAPLWLCAFNALRVALTQMDRRGNLGCGLDARTRRLVIAARKLAFGDFSAIYELDAASEAFAGDVPWENEPDDAQVDTHAKRSNKRK